MDIRVGEEKMIDIFSCLMAALIFGFVIILPVYVNVFKEQIYLYIKERIANDEKIEKLKKQMMSNKKKKK